MDTVTGAPNEVRLGAVVTFVLWFGCVTVGVLGLLLSYPRPRPPFLAPAPVQAASVDVDIVHIPLAPPDTVRSLTALSTPAPAPTPTRVPDAMPLLAVAIPAPDVAFPLPVDGPTRVVAPAQAAYVRPPSFVPAPSAPSPVQPLTFGIGEGKQPAPVYPPAAIRLGQEGTVRVRFSVGEDGRVQAAEVVGPSPWPLLNDVTLRTVRQRWRFASNASRPYEVSIRFQLHK